MGAWITVAPAAWASSTSFFVFSSICVESMTSWTAPWSAPPSDVKSFWNSISTTAVDFGSVAIWPPLDRGSGYARRHVTATRARHGLESTRDEIDGRGDPATHPGHEQHREQDGPIQAVAPPGMDDRVDVGDEDRRQQARDADVDESGDHDRHRMLGHLLTLGQTRGVCHPG